MLTNKSQSMVLDPTMNFIPANIKFVLEITSDLVIISQISFLMESEAAHGA